MEKKDIENIENKIKTLSAEITRLHKESWNHYKNFQQADRAHLYDGANTYFDLYDEAHIQKLALMDEVDALKEMLGIL